MVSEGLDMDEIELELIDAGLEDIEDAEPLYRVQIEGFQSDNEAKEFMTQYGLFNGAFLVRK